MNLEDTIRMVRTITQEQPDYIYTAKPCVYNCNPDQEGPRCIFGEAWHRLGVRLHPMLNNHSIVDVLQETQTKFTPRQLQWCQCVQEEQDGGATWAKSVKIADELSPLRSRKEELIIAIEAIERAIEATHFTATADVLKKELDKLQKELEK